MPLRALAKMTNGAISMGMVDGIVMEAKGFWIIGPVSYTHLDVYKRQVKASTVQQPG